LCNPPIVYNNIISIKQIKNKQIISGFGINIFSGSGQQLQRDPRLYQGQPGAAASGFGVRDSGPIETGQPIGRPALVVLEDYKQRYTPAHVTGASEKRIEGCPSIPWGYT